jgi:hypothetical protein
MRSYDSTGVPVSVEDNRTKSGRNLSRPAYDLSSPRYLLCRYRLNTFTMSKNRRTVASSK